MNNYKEWMSDDQYECACLYADIVGGFHHIYGRFKPWGEGITINVPGTWASFDFNQLTKIVILGHDRMIRVCIRACNPQYFKLELFKRHKREGLISERHPTIEEAIVIARE